MRSVATSCGTRTRGTMWTRWTSVTVSIFGPRPRETHLPLSWANVSGLFRATLRVDTEPQKLPLCLAQRGKSRGLLFVVVAPSRDAAAGEAVNPKTSVSDGHDSTSLLQLNPPDDGGMTIPGMDCGSQDLTSLAETLVFLGRSLSNLSWDGIDTLAGYFETTPAIGAAMEWKYELHPWNPFTLYEFPFIQRHVLSKRFRGPVVASFEVFW